MGHYLFFSVDIIGPWKPQQNIQWPTSIFIKIIDGNRANCEDDGVTITLAIQEKLGIPPSFH